MFKTMLICLSLLSCIHALPSHIDTGYTLVWEDEFEGPAFDTTKWDYRGLGPRRIAVQVREAVKTDGNGNLYITSSKVGTEYHTGMISTSKKYETKNGYFECKAKLGHARTGVWSAFWIQGDLVGQDDPDYTKNGTEIDIYEYFQVNPTEVQHNLHWGGYAATHKTDGHIRTQPGLDTGWHTFGVEWTEGTYRFYVDDVLSWSTISAVSPISEYMILSTEMDTYWGAIADAELPDTTWWDYVRVYKRRQRATAPTDSVRLRSDGMAMVNGTPFFPIMAYRSSSTLGATSAAENTFEAALRDLPKIKAEGYNVAHNYCFETSSPTPPLSAQQAIDYLKAADTIGLRVFLGVHRPYIDTFPRYEYALRDLVETVSAANANALFMWYLRDEPLFGAIQGRSLVNTVRAADPFHLTHFDHYATNATQITQRLSWFDSTGVDSWSMQCYDTWGDNFAPYAAASTVGAKYVVERLDQTAGLRTDVYTSLCAGANGYMTYIYLTEPPMGTQYLDAMRLNQELRILSPVLTQVRNSAPVFTPSGLLIRSQIDERDSSIHLIAVNRSGAALSADIALTGEKGLSGVERLFDGSWTIQGTGGNIQVTVDSGFSDNCLTLSGRARLVNTIGYQSRYAGVTLTVSYQVRPGQNNRELMLPGLAGDDSSPVAMKLGADSRFWYLDSVGWHQTAAYQSNQWHTLQYTVRLDTLNGNAYDISLNGTPVAAAIPFKADHLNRILIGKDTASTGSFDVDNISLIHTSAHATSAVLLQDNFNGYATGLPPVSTLPVTGGRRFTDTYAPGQTRLYRLTLGDTVTDTLLFHYTRDFSRVQGQNNCRYQYRTGTTFTDMTWDSVKGRWAGNETYLYLSNGGMHPGVNSDPVLKWTSPVTGSLRITGTVRKANLSAGDGILATIKRGDTVIWGPTAVAWNDAAGVSHDIALSVDSGEVISFTINKNGNDGADGTAWDPQVYMETGGTTGLQSFRPHSFPILNAVPNPFHARVEVSGLNMGKPVSLCVYDIRGAKVADLTHQISADARGFRSYWNAGKQPAGIYFIRLHEGKTALNRKIILTH